MSKPTTKKPPAPPVTPDANGKTLKERDAEAIDRMMTRFVKKREELDVDKYFRALVKLGGS
jgi:hypothetical protein